jgi:pimeloyl-ACP methyl ester carboxylesterase
MRRNLNVGLGFLAATSGADGVGRLRLRSYDTEVGRISTTQAGSGPPLLALHGLGGTKASFLSTLQAMQDGHTVIAADLPGFGDSAKPIRARYDAPFFARAVTALLDAMGIARANVAGHSLGGRVALELGLTAAERLDRLVLLCPAMAWLRPRSWAPVVRLLRPELRLLPLVPTSAVDALARHIVPGGTDGWTAAAVDEFTRRPAADTPSMPSRATSISTNRTAPRASGRGCDRSNTSACSSGDYATASRPAASCITSSVRCRRPTTSSFVADTCPCSSSRTRCTTPCGRSFRPEVSPPRRGPSLPGGGVVGDFASVRAAPTHTQRM